MDGLVRPKPLPQISIKLQNGRNFAKGLLCYVSLTTDRQNMGVARATITVFIPHCATNSDGQASRVDG